MATLYQPNKIPLSIATATNETPFLLWTSPALTANQFMLIRARLHATTGGNANVGYAEVVGCAACNGSGTISAGVGSSSLSQLNGSNAVMIGAALTGLTIAFAISGNSITVSGANSLAVNPTYYWLTGEYEVFVGV